MVRKAGIKKTVGDGIGVGCGVFFTTCEARGEETMEKKFITIPKQKREWTSGTFPNSKGAQQEDECADHPPFLEVLS